jgi:hypothetical protein
VGLQVGLENKAVLLLRCIVVVQIVFITLPVRLLHLVVGLQVGLEDKVAVEGLHTQFTGEELLLGRPEKKNIINENTFPVVYCTVQYRFMSC